MDYWSFASYEKSKLFPENTDLSVNGLLSPNNLDNMLNLRPDRERKTSKLMELSVPEMMLESVPSTANLRICDGENGNGYMKVLPSFCPATPSLPLREFDRCSRLSSSIVESTSNRSSVMDLKLGKLGGYREAKKSMFSLGRAVESSVGSSSPAKRSRMENMCSQSPACQVHGCNKDLSSSKDYHKRHKVCDLHSKTAKVIVNGIEQRFCQQCSRFHLLAEFDDGKRSCRKRLAGHNERRRKVSLDTHYGKPQTVLQRYQGTSFSGASFQKRTSFAFAGSHQDFSQGRYDQDNQCRHIKFEGESIYSPETAMPFMNKTPKSFPHSHSVRKQIPSKMFSFEGDYTALDAASSIKESSGVSSSSCALSLLSAQSQSMSSYSTTSLLANSLKIQDAHDNRNVDQHSKRPSRESNLEFVPGGCYLSGMNAMEVDQVGASMIFDNDDSLDFESIRDEIFQRSDSMNSQFCFLPENEPLVDLIQLSSHLKRLEQHRQQENNVSATLGALK